MARAGILITVPSHESQVIDHAIQYWRVRTITHAQPNYISFCSAKYEEFVPGFMIIFTAGSGESAPLITALFPLILLIFNKIELYN